MPYIKQDDRATIDEWLVNSFDKVVITNPGDLNYAITRLCLAYLPANPSYSDFNSIIGVLDSAKFEFYRRKVAPYENQKAFDNGDVYDV